MPVCIPVQCIVLIGLYSAPLAVAPNSVAANGSGPELHSIPSENDPSTSGPELSDLLSDYGDDDFASEVPPNARAPAAARSGIEDSSDGGRDDNSDDDASNYSETPHQRPSTPPMFAQKPAPPDLRLQTVDTTSDQKHETDQSRQLGSPRNPAAQLNKPLPKSPGANSPLATFFGWGNSPSGTNFSHGDSPVSPNTKAGPHDTPRTITANTSMSEFKGNNLGYHETYPPASPLPFDNTSYHIEEMEEELKAISSELAASIRREIDLEDLVDRLQEQVSTGHIPGKRTSDYFSDSGYSSAKLSEYETGREEVERVQRRAEQEKASLHLELSSKLQDERSIRKELDRQIKELSERAAHTDLAEMNNMNTTGRVKDLETTCEDLRRRLSEERSSKDNFEDLLSALKGELQDACTERDNLRDKLIPQLRARVEGLEAESAEYSNLTYESTKMQQEIQNLRAENITLRRNVPSDEPPSRGSRVMSMYGVGALGGLSRSNSSATNFRMQMGPSSGLSRSNSIKATPQESREVIAERLKDVEAQRDALHGALKNLLERQEFQNRENAKKIKILEMERERLLTGGPKKAGFQRDIVNLRTEINVLRRRAEDAMEQKWQVEKGLGGLKMDLDRAEGEIASLRELLQEKDILIPESLARQSHSGDGPVVPVTSDTLNTAYQKLQTAYSESLDRIKQLDTGADADEKTHLAMERLESALSVAVNERDAARKEIDSLRSRYDGMAASEAQSIAAERALADDLSDSAQQIEQLACHVNKQLTANAELRQRVVAAVTRGDAERQANNHRITLLQENLRQIEDQLVAAQTASEDKITHHEDDLSTIRDAHNEQLHRMNIGRGREFGSSGLGSTRKADFMANSAHKFFAAGPQIAPKSFEDEAEVKLLRAKVAQLEKALEEAEKEMQEVIARMNTAQIEVLTLQEEREAAVRETRRLQQTLESEQSKSFESRFRSLAGFVA